METTLKWGSFSGIFFIIETLVINLIVHNKLNIFLNEDLINLTKDVIK